MDKKLHFLILLIIILAGAAVYSNTYNVPFLFDDFEVIINSRPQSMHFTLADLKDSRAVGNLTFILNYMLGGRRVWHYHLINTIVHIGCGLLTYFICLLTLRTPRIGSPPVELNRVLFASVASLIFLVHPIQTMGVTYIVQRYASLASFFYLLSLLGYIKARLDNNKKAYVVALLSAVLAMKTKQISLTLPFSLLLYELLFFEGTAKKRASDLLPFFLTLGIIPLDRIGSLSPGNQDSPVFSVIINAAKETSLISRHDYLLTQFRVIMTYLKLLFHPVNQNIDYDFPISNSLANHEVLLSGLSILLLVLIALRVRKILPIVSFAILWFFLTLSVESSIIPIADVIMEHRLYLPMVGFAIFSSYTLSRVNEIKVRVSLIIAMLITLSLLTFSRNTVWQSEEALWKDAAQKSPHKMRPHANLGVYYIRMNRLDEAIRETELALKYGSDVRAVYNLGLAYQYKGMHDQARNIFEKIIAVTTVVPEPYNALGMISMQKKEYEQAIDYFQKAIKLRPYYADSYFNIGATYLILNNKDKALPYLNLAVEKNPNIPMYHFLLGRVLQEKGDYQTALAHYLSYRELNPLDDSVFIVIAKLFTHSKEIGQGIKFFNKAIVKEQNSSLFFSLGLLYEALNDRQKAEDAFKKALGYPFKGIIPDTEIARIKKEYTERQR